MGNFQGWVKYARILFAFSWLFIFWKGGIVGCDVSNEQQIKIASGFIDSDSDGLSDSDEIVKYHTQVGRFDTDGDGLSDGDEANKYHTDPNNPDTDNDLLNDGEEIMNGTDPFNRDSDGDGFDDGREVAAPSDPLDAGSTPDWLDCDGYYLYDVNGHLYDIYCDGDLDDGTSDSYDSMYYLSINGEDFPEVDDGWSEAGGRGIVLGPENMSGLDVTRKIFVPTDNGWARYLEILSNNTGSPITVGVQIYGNLGSDSDTTIITTSSGDTVFTPDDRYLVTDDADNGSDDPALAHVFDGPGGLIHVDDVFANNGNDDIWYEWTVTIQPHRTVVVMHFAVQQWWEADAITSANNLEAMNGKLQDGMLTQEKLDTVNWERPLDTDEDGMSDWWEIHYGLDPNNPNDASEDKDSDGLTNLEEYQIGTDPGSSDTDLDGINDGDEVHEFGTNPLKADSDSDGLGDLQEICFDGDCSAYTPGSDADPNNADTDGDLYPDGYEVSHGTDPLDNLSPGTPLACNGGCTLLAVNGTLRIFDSVPRTDTTSYVNARNNCLAAAGDMTNFDETYQWQFNVWMQDSADVAYYSYENTAFCEAHHGEWGSAPTCCGMIGDGFGWDDLYGCSCHDCDDGNNYPLDVFSNGNNGGYVCVWR